MNLNDAIKKGRVVVVAGAGISKDPPSNLPSWWDYNLILLEMIGKLGAEAIGKDDNLLDVHQLMAKIPVVAISEFIVNRIAGKSYYPLLSLLDGSKPNINHLMLAQLAKEESICAIITTNFDTLLEKAFEEESVQYNKIEATNDCCTKKDAKGFPIYKIHGSADNTEFAIDTVHQKLRGLSIEKKEMMKRLFSYNHILFMGFSGEDFLFGSDYIPVQVNTEGISWIAHPGSRFNEYTEKILNEKNVDCIYSTLEDFYLSCGWDVPQINNYSTNGERSFRERAEEKVRDFLEQPNIGKMACLGMCIELLENIGEDVSQLVCLAEEALSKKELNIIEALQCISLLTSLSMHALRNNDFTKAQKYCVSQIKIFSLEDEIIKEMPVNPKANRERDLNRSTVTNRIGLTFFYKEQYSEAMEWFTMTLHYAYHGMHLENIANALFNIGRCKYYYEYIENQNKEMPRFMVFIECARRIAEHGGFAQIQFDINCELVRFYMLFGQKELMEEAYYKAKRLQTICIQSDSNKKKLEDIQKFFNTFIEGDPWPKKHIPINEPYDWDDIWHPFGQRPVLKYEEGKRAKELYDGGKYKDCLDYLSEVINTCKNNNELLKKDIFLDSAVGILLDIANRAAVNGDDETNKTCLVQAKQCLELCVDLEILLLKIDYLAETLGSLSKVSFMLGELSDLDLTIFQAEFALCLSSDPTECWQSLVAMEVACRSNHAKGKLETAKYYCKEYLETVAVYPNIAFSINVEQMRKLYNELQDI